jgi:hypothetical protein
MSGYGRRNDFGDWKVDCEACRHQVPYTSHRSGWRC